MWQKLHEAPVIWNDQYGIFLKFVPYLHWMKGIVLTQENAVFRYMWICFSECSDRIIFLLESFFERSREKNPCDFVNGKEIFLGEPFHHGELISVEELKGCDDVDNVFYVFWFFAQDVVCAYDDAGSFFFSERYKDESSGGEGVRIKNIPHRIGEGTISKGMIEWNDIKIHIDCAKRLSETEIFFDFFGFLRISTSLFGRCGFFSVNILELFPFVLCFDDESFDDFSFGRHEFAEFYAFILEYLDKFVDLKLREDRNGIDHSFFLECRERE